jgi:peptidoglycan/LPS O-acetylase OafA/YrhL
MKNIPELNGLRGVAVLAVFFHHAFYATLGSTLTVRWGLLAGLSARLFQYGDAGVDLFFVLSGFLITSLLFRDRQNPAFYRDFYWKRALRIGPVLLVALGITLALHEFKYALLSLFFLANFGAPLHIFGTAPFWSLAIEEQFYLLWPTAVRRLRPDRIAVYAACVAGSSFALRCAFGFMGHSNYHLTPLRCDGLALGAMLALLKCRRVKIKPVFLWGAGACGILCLVLCTWIAYYPLGEPFRELGTVLLCTAIVGLCIENSGALCGPLLCSERAWQWPS